MKVTRIDCHVLLVPEFHTEACSSAQDNLVVQIHTDAGISGIGETDVNPWIARACIRAMGTHIMGLGLEEMLIGEDPLQPEAIWQKLYSGSKMNGRRGALICAMGAIDMALWDIKGKAMGCPDLQAARRRRQRLDHTLRLPAAHRRHAGRIPRLAQSQAASRARLSASRRQSSRSASTVPTPTTLCKNMTIISPALSPNAATPWEAK